MARPGPFGVVAKHEDLFRPVALQHLCEIVEPDSGTAQCGAVAHGNVEELETAGRRLRGKFASEHVLSGESEYPRQVRLIRWWGSELRHLRRRQLCEAGLAALGTDGHRHRPNAFLEDHASRGSGQRDVADA